MVGAVGKPETVAEFVMGAVAEPETVVEFRVGAVAECSRGPKIVSAHKEFIKELTGRGGRPQKRGGFAKLETVDESHWVPLQSVRLSTNLIGWVRGA